MRYILRLSARIFKNNKIKNSIVILAIAIAFSFVGIYFVFADALYAFFLQSNLRQMGTEAEAEYRNVTYEEYLQFKEENRTLCCFYGTRLEQWMAGEYNSRQVVLNYMEEEAAGLCFAELTEGAWPETENEVAIDKNYGRYIEEIDSYFWCKICGFRHLQQQFQSRICKYLFVGTGICKIQNCGCRHSLRGCGRQKTDKRVSCKRMECCFSKRGTGNSGKCGL